VLKLTAMPSRFFILKTKLQPTLYGVFDGELETFVAWADCLEMAQEIAKDIERIVLEDAIVDSAMEDLGL